MIISINKNWKDAEESHTRFISRKIITYLKEKPITKTSKKTWDFVNDIFPYLVICNKDDIEESIRIYRKHLTFFNSKERPIFINTIKKIFNYDNFIKKHGAWNAYELCKKSIARTCPYCNQAYAFTFQVKGKGFRPTLDHFYSKDTFPHLALALNNLIPSCYTCNSSLKGRKDFFKNEHLNPLWDDENITFSLSHKNDLLNFEQALKNDPAGVIVNTNIDRACKKTDASIKTFMLKERYDFLSFEAAEFARSKLDFMYAKNSGIEPLMNISEASILRFDPINYKKYILGKLYLGINNQIEQYKVNN